MGAAGRHHRCGRRRDRLPVSYRRQLRHGHPGGPPLDPIPDAGGGPCHRGALQALPSGGQGHQRHHRVRSLRRKRPHSAGAGDLRVHRHYPPVRRQRRPGGCGPSDRRRPGLPGGQAPAPGGKGPAPCHPVRHERRVRRPVRHAPDRHGVRPGGHQRGRAVLRGPGALHHRRHGGLRCIRPHGGWSPPASRCPCPG